MTAYINNGSSSGDYGALVVDGAKLILPTGMQWLSDGGMQLKMAVMLNCEREHLI